MPHPDVCSETGQLLEKVSVDATVSNTGTLTYILQNDRCTLYLFITYFKGTQEWDFLEFCNI